MIRTHRAWLGALALTTAVLVGTGPAWAVQAQTQTTAAKVAELSKLLPNDTEVLFAINFQQILDSGLVKKFALEHLKTALKKDEVQDVLTSLGFDPLKDLGLLVSAGPAGSDPEKGLTILTGKFDVAKFHKKAKEVARANEGVLKITKSGNFEVWEVTVNLANLGNLGNIPNLPVLPPTFYVAIPDKSVLLVAASKTYLNEALDKVAGKRKTELKKEIAALVAKMDKKQSISFLALGSVLAKVDVPIDAIKGIVEQLKSLKTLTGGITLGDDIKVKVGLGAKDANSARQLGQSVRKGIFTAQFLVGALAMNNEQLAPVADILKTITTKVQGTQVTITGAVPKDLIDNAMKMVQGGG